MDSLNPQTFWNRYRDQLRNLGSWDAYQSNCDWTEIAKRCAEGACAELGLEYSREYLRLDVCGYVQRDAKHDWHLRVAFEVENSAMWKDELCKLAHVVADLRVLVGYECHKSWKAIDALGDYVPTLRDRITRVPGSEWLFIFGPDWRKPEDAWTAWTLDHQSEVISIIDAHPLRGIDMGNK